MEVRKSTCISKTNVSTSFNQKLGFRYGSGHNEKGEGNDEHHQGKSNHQFFNQSKGPEGHKLRIQA